MTADAERLEEISAELEKIRLSRTRLAAVQETGLIDQPELETLGRLSKLATQLIDVPVSFLSLVDEDRDFYVSLHGSGLPLPEERQLSGPTLCHLALINEGPLVINDTRSHPLYRAMPTVATLKIGAYLGVPIRGVSGELIGSFCAIDFKPREWSQRETRIMQELAMSAQREVNLLTMVNSHQQHVDDTKFAQAASVISAASVETARLVLHSVAHDIRNPVATISISLELIRRIAAEPKLEKALQIAERQIRSIQRMLDDLLDGARIDTGTLHLVPEDFPISKLFTDLIEDFSDVADAADIHFSFEDVDASLSLHADRPRIAQIMGNLVTNALKFTPRGGTVTLSAHVERDFLALRVADSGTKIAPDVALKIFEPFWQADPTARIGLGLGLSIARTLVELHGGTIFVSDDGTDGNTFVMRLPLAA